MKTNIRPAEANCRRACLGLAVLGLLAAPKTALGQEQVRRQLVDRGVDPEQARLRLAALDDEQIAAIQANMDALPAGSGVLEVVVAVLLVLVILDLVGVTNIFPFIR